MTSFKIPAHDGCDEFTEKKSRFIGVVRYTKTEEEALAFMEPVAGVDFNADLFNIYKRIARQLH